MSGLKKNLENSDSILLLLEEDSPENFGSKIRAHWNKTIVVNGEVSVPSKVEEHISEIKEKYLSWVYDFGQTKLEGKTMTEHLRILEGLSFWWMTYLGEKSPYKCPAIHRVFKLMALEKVYRENACRGIIYCGNDPMLHQILSQWCGKMSHPYQRIPASEKPETIKKSLDLKEIFCLLPNLAQACIWLIHRWWVRFRNLKTNPPAQDANENRVTLVTYFPNIDKEETKKGRFRSRYWEEFHQLLDQSPLAVNWIWFYFKQNEIII